MAKYPVFDVRKTGYLVKLTDEEVATIHPVRFFTAEERSVERAESNARAAAVRARITTRLAAAHPALQPIIDLHADTHGRWSCEGCDAGSYAEDSPDWPCSTIELILDGLGQHIG
jgi:hypothetical protein